MRFTDLKHWITREPDAEERAQLDAALQHRWLRMAWQLTSWPRRYFFPLLAGLALLLIFIAGLASGLLEPLLDFFY